MVKHLRVTLEGNAYVDSEENGHIVKTEKLVPEKHAKIIIADDGYVRCTACNKAIRYPLVSFDDIDYCPKCGAKIDKEESNEN